MRSERATRSKRRGHDRRQEPPRAFRARWRRHRPASARNRVTSDLLLHIALVLRAQLAELLANNRVDRLGQYRCVAELPRDPKPANPRRHKLHLTEMPDPLVYR